MKTLLTSSLIATVLLSGSPVLQIGNSHQVNMQLQADEVLQDMVKVFDYHGNLIREMRVDDVAQDEISISDYLILESSHFAFSYLGDQYYLRD